MITLELADHNRTYPKHPVSLKNRRCLREILTQGFRESSTTRVFDPAFVQD